MFNMLDSWLHADIAHNYAEQILDGIVFGVDKIFDGARKSGYPPDGKNKTHNHWYYSCRPRASQIIIRSWKR